MRSMDVDNDDGTAFGDHTDQSLSQNHTHHKVDHVCYYKDGRESIYGDSGNVFDDKCGGNTNDPHSPSHKHLDDHGYSSLHDMIEVDMKSHTSAVGDTAYTLSDSVAPFAVNVFNSANEDCTEQDNHNDSITSTTNGYETSEASSNIPDRSATLSPPMSLVSSVVNNTSSISSSTTTGALPPINSNTIDLDSSVSNLSWLQNIQQQMPENNGSATLVVNPQTATPNTFIRRVGEGQRNIRVVNVTMPSNVHLSNTGNIKYVTVQGSKQPVRITASRPLLSHASAYPSTAQGYHRLYNQTSSSLPSSTVPDNPYPKPAYSYSCLIALSLKNSRCGRLPVAEIYNFMMTNFPYFKTAPDGWKNSVRHNLSLNKCFEKIENPNSDGTHSRKGCLWAMNSAKIKKMDEEIAKWNKKDLIAIRRSMANPEMLDILTKGQGSFLVEKSRSRNNLGQAGGSQFPHRPGIRIVTAVQAPQAQKQQVHISSTLERMNTAQANVVVERQDQLIDQIDFNRLVEDATDLFGDHDDLALDPSLSELALQNGVFEDIQNDIFELPPLCNQNTSMWTPTTSSTTSRIPVSNTHKSTTSSHMYNTSNTILPIIF